MKAAGCNGSTVAGAVQTPEFPRAIDPDLSSASPRHAVRQKPFNKRLGSGAQIENMVCVAERTIHKHQPRRFFFVFFPNAGFAGDVLESRGCSA